MIDLILEDISQGISPHALPLFVRKTRNSHLRNEDFILEVLYILEVYKGKYHMKRASLFLGKYLRALASIISGIYLSH